MENIYHGLVKASDLPPAKEIQRLWHGIYPGSFTLLNGDTGAGKSALLLNMAVHAALNEPLWDIPFGAGRPLKVLYVDPENGGNFKEGDGGLSAVRLERLAKGRPEGLMFHNGRFENGASLNLSSTEHLSALGQAIIREKIDLLILDPYANLFAVENENDNREANRNVTALVKLCRDTGCATVLTHHTGKAGEEMGISPKYGRGASALLGAVDVGLTLRLRSARKDDGSDDDGHGEAQTRNDTVRLKIEKNRMEGKSTSVYLSMVGNDQFERVSPAVFHEGRSPNDKSEKRQQKIEEAKSLILDVVKGDETYNQGQLVAKAKDKRIVKSAVDEALAMLTGEKTLDVHKGARGANIYSLPNESSTYIELSATPEGRKVYRCKEPALTAV